ncbi:hypothetical protein JCM8208_003025 [Rhodotorula glutinis]
MSRPPPPRRSPPAPPPAAASPVPQLAPSGAPSNTARTTAIQTTPSVSHVFRHSPLDAILADQGLTRYHLEPPSWRAPWILEPHKDPSPNKSLGRAAGLLKVQSSAATAAAGDKDDVDKGRTRPWPVFYPPRDGMDEDSMAEALVKSGYSAKSVVQAETFSAHQHIYDKLKTTDVLGNLSRLVAAVHAKADESLPSYGPSTFRLPSRITLIDLKREAWFADLASPAVPLSKLSRSVPHGYKGEKGLDMLAHRRVEVGRAVWFVRAFGGIEIQSLAKTRPVSTAIAQYTTEFTTVVSEFVRKQLAEVVLPSSSSSSSATASAGALTTTPGAAPSHPGTPTAVPVALAALGRSRSGSLGSAAQQQAQAVKAQAAADAARQGGAAGAAAGTTAAGGGGGGASGGERGLGLFGDEERRRTWEGKFDYTVRLVESLYQEALLDRPIFLHFLVSLLDPPPPSTATGSEAGATLGQLSFALLLVEEYFGDLLQSETATARLVRAGLLRLEELESAPPSSLSTTISTTLTSLIRSAFLAHPDSFVSLLPSPIYPLSTSRTNSPSRTASSTPSSPSGARLEKLLLSTGQDHAIDDAHDGAVLVETVAADVAELRARRALAQPTDGAASSSSSGSNESLEVDDQALLAAIERLDEIEFPARMRDVHRALFVAPAVRPLAHVCGSSPAALRAPASTSTRSPAQDGHPPPPADDASTSSPSTTVRPLTLAHALPLLFTWCTTTTRPLPAPHRRYAVSRLVALELERLDADAGGGRSRRLTRSSSRSPVPSVEDAFVRWVDERFPSSSVAIGATAAAGAAGPPAAPVEKRDVRALAEELLRSGVLSYGAYLQRLIARGETEPRPVAGAGGDEPGESVHLWILRTVALPASGVGARRRVVASGGEAGVERALRVDELEGTVRGELSRLVFAETVPAGAECGTLLGAVRALREEGAHGAVAREVLPEGLSARLDQATGRIGLEVEQMAVIVAVYEVCEDWCGLVQLLVVILKLSPPLPVVLHIIDVLEAHLDVATTLDSLVELGTALFAAHESLKVCHTPPERRLLALLRRLGTAGCLSSTAKDTLEADIRNLASSLTASRAQTQALPSPLTEFQSLLIDSSPAAISQLASTLWFRYHAHPSWSTIALDSVLRMAPQLPPATATCPSPAAALLRALHDRLPTGLEPVLARWISTMSAAQLCATFGGPDGPVRAALLNELVVEGTIGAIGMLKGVVLPLRRVLLSLLTPAAAGQLVGTGHALAPTDPAAAQALHNTHTILSSVIFSAPEPAAAGTSPPSTSSPTTLATQQRLAARRASLGTRPALLAVAASLALLVVQQDVASVLGLPDLAESTGALFLRLGTLSELQTLVVRDPAAFKDAMLDSETVGAVPMIELFRPKLLAGLLLLLKDGGAATPASLVSTEDWDLFLSGLTLWRLSTSKVEVESCLERLELDDSISSADKVDALHTLSSHFLERVCSGEGQSYLGEQVVKCYKGSASDELVSVAFSRIADAISALTSTSPSLEHVAVARTTLRCASRLLDTLLQSGTATSRTDSIDRLLKAIKTGFLADSVDHLDQDETQDLMLDLAHLVTVALRCTRKPTEKSTAELYRDCIVPLARHAAHFARDLGQLCELPTLLFDTCSHLLFALPDLHPCLRPPTLQTLLSPSTVASRLAIELLPDSTFARLTRLFGQYAPASLVANPWELLDHTDPSSAVAAAVVRRSSQHPAPQLVNIGPLDLAAFRARVVETIPAVTALDAVSTTSTTSSAPPGQSAPERGAQTSFDFETPCTTLPVAARDHRRTLAVTRLLAQRMEQNTATAAAHAQAQAQAQAQAASSGAGRKRSATGTDAVKPQGATPAPPASAAAAAAAASATSAPPAAVAPTSGRGAKRKTTSTAEVVVLDSDEEQAPSKAKKAKAGASSGTGTAAAAARKTTGGKTASKTVKRKR